MKKFIILITILIGTLLFPLQAFAMDYTIDGTRIDASLQENGDVYVTEKHMYSFEGKFKGITRSLIPKKKTKIVDVEASENGSTLKVEQDDNAYKVFRSGKDETITIELSYIIKDGVQVYADVAQFYWPFFDESNETDYEQFDVYIHPPQPAEDVIAFGYFEAEGTASVENSGIAHFAMGEVDSGNNGNIRVAYDAKLFPGATLTKDKPMRGEILAEKKELEDKQAAFEKRKSILSGITPFVISIFAIYLLILLFVASRKKQMTNLEVERRFTSAYFVPKEEMSLPATISYMKAGIMQAEALTASLLDLVRKGYVKRESEDTFVVKNRDTDYKHELLLIEWLFDTIGNNGLFRFNDLKDYTDKKSNHKSYQEKFTAWKQAVQEEVKHNDLLEKNTKMRSLIALTAIPLFVLFILFAVHELVFGAVLSLFIFIGLIVFALCYRPRTVKGARIKRQWDEFQLKYPDINEKEWNKLMDNEQKRAFIYGFGIKDKKIEKKNQQMLEPHLNTSYPNADIMFFLLIATTVNQQFDKANTVAAASTTTGGTPGGGAGVGGGGGGSGAF